MMTDPGRPPARYSDHRPLRTRTGAIALTTALHVLVVLALVLRWQTSAPMHTAPATFEVKLIPEAAEPEPEKPIPPTPPPEQPQQQPPLLQPVSPVIEAPRMLLAAPNQMAAAAQPDPEPSTAPPAEPSTPAPPPAAPPAAPRDGPDSWEARVMARLERVKRYPSAARVGRVQGVAYVRFRVNRQGRVLFASLQRSSGSDLLDKAALETVRRAEPLPEIPKDRPAEIEVAVPVEFFLR